MRRSLIVAYAISMTVLAAWWGLQAWSYRRFFAGLSRSQGRSMASPSLRSIYLDFGVDRMLWDDVAIRLADLSAPFIMTVILLIFVASFVVGLWSGRPLAGELGQVEAKKTASLRWTACGTLASLVIGASTFLLTWIFIRWRMLHPHPLPTVVLFTSQGVAAAIGFSCGSWRALRGPRRLAGGTLAAVALVPIILWSGIGLYAWSQWRQRLVPNDLPMNLAKMAALSLFRLEASVEYPNRLETDRLVMFYNRLDDPRRDAAAMDRHLARMEGMLGGPLRTKVYWVRGRLHRLDLGSMCLHGFALGSGESPTDWNDGGILDCHELAHAALDEYRLADADPPYFLLEGWAESQSGVGPIVLAKRALEQHSSEPSLGIREMFSPFWYHRDSGPVYPLGGAFVDHVIRVYGIKTFLRLYNECRPGTFDTTCREVFAADLNTVETKFWDDVQRQAGGSP